MTMRLTYRYRGARAMVLLHDQHLREFLATWRSFKTSGRPLPQTDDPAYETPETLLCHVLGAAAGYMRWMCEKLGLPEPGIRAVPLAKAVEAEADEYLEHVLEKWRTPLAEVPEDRFGEAHEARWGGTYLVDAMMEHAVMHPIRHTFQLGELLSRPLSG